MLRFRPDVSKVIPKYISEIFKIKIFIEEMQKYAIKAANQASLNSTNIKNLKIPVPPKDIQQKIVAEIESLDLIEADLKSKLAIVIIEVNKIVDAVGGPLVRLEELTSKIGSGSTPRGGEASYIETGITLIRSQNVYDNEFYHKGLVYIDDDQAKKLDGVTVEENDVLFNITGASVCRCCMVDKSYLPARVNQHVAILRTNEKALPKFVQQLLISKKFKKELLALADNSTTREAITKAQLEDFKIPLPLLSEQQKIVDEIEIIESKIAKLKGEIAVIPEKKEAVLKNYLN